MEDEASMLSLQFVFSTRQVVIILKTVMAVYVTTPFGEKITEHRAELVSMNKRIEVRNGPAAEGTTSIQAFISNGL